MTNDAPLRVCSFESRRGNEMRSLLERHGCEATIAPSMREVPLDEHAAVFHFVEELQADRIQIVIFMTGVGAKALLTAVETRSPKEEFFRLLNGVTTVVRGPKSVAVLREWGVRIDHRAPEPNTWRELLRTLDEFVPLSGKTVAVQEYGVPNAEFYAALAERGAAILSVPVYRWEFPEDPEPLRKAVHDTIAGKFDVLMLTSANQLHNVLKMADAEGVRDAWMTAAPKCVIASIGPTASEAIQGYGLPVDVEPAHGKMGTLVRETSERARTILASKP
ncbi:MAG TPA: uroporphyrinogen-III synthase [Planctomycetaceae bacterium]|nr:uroporphyrinogen-III synthase [Planctomycetaceae bacterium]